MPYCRYRRCKRVATREIGTINYPSDDMPSGIWDEVTYVCDKHYVKLLKLLGVKQGIVPKGEK